MGWEKTKPYLSALRAANTHRQRPTAMILHDPYALNREWWNPDWVPATEDRAWVGWDYALAGAYQVIEDFTDESGQYIPYDASGEVDWEVKSKFSGSNAAIERARESRKELRPGESLYAVAVFRDPDNKPTLKSWAASVQDGVDDGRPPEAEGARPPTGAELRALRDSLGSGENV